MSLAWRDDVAREPGPAVVVDLDGTLSDAAGRQHHLERRPEDWDGFFAGVGDDPLVDQVARLVELLESASTSARPSTTTPGTPPCSAPRASRASSCSRDTPGERAERPVSCGRNRAGWR